MTYVVPARVAHCGEGSGLALADTVYVMRVPDGQPMVLTGSAAWIWCLVADGEVDVTGTLADALDMPRDALEADVSAFLTDLAEHGFLETATTGSG